jgi:hypothetical protein
MGQLSGQGSQARDDRFGQLVQGLGELGCLNMHDLLQLQKDTGLFGWCLIPLVCK